MLEVEGAYHYGEYDDKFHVRVIFKCPYCNKRHTQFVNGTGKTPDGVELKAMCQRGSLKVVPYRAKPGGRTRE